MDAQNMFQKLRSTRTRAENSASFGVPTERRLVMMVPVVIGTDRHALTVEGLEEIGFLY